MCLIAGVWLIASGFIMIVIEAPFCCMFLDFVASFAEMVERRPPWQKAALYIVWVLSKATYCHNWIMMTYQVGHSTCVSLSRTLDTTWLRCHWRCRSSLRDAVCRKEVSCHQLNIFKLCDKIILYSCCGGGLVINAKFSYSFLFQIFIFIALVFKNSFQVVHSSPFTFEFYLYGFSRNDAKFHSFLSYQ